VSFHEFKDVNGADAGRYLIVGQVVGIRINEDYMRAGRFDLDAVTEVARCGDRDYAAVSGIFEVQPPAEDAMQVLR
jgi:hypothetical protein